MHDAANKSVSNVLFLRAPSLHDIDDLLYSKFVTMESSQNINPNESNTTTEPPAEENDSQPCRLLKLPLELRERILKLIFQDHIDHIDTIPFPCPATLTLQPRFNPSYNVALCKSILTMLHTSRRLRLESFDVYMPLSLEFYAAVKAEYRKLQDEVLERGIYAIKRDKDSSERHYLNALRGEGAMQIFLALQQAEANSRAIVKEGE